MAGYYVIHSEPFECLSIHPSVRASFPISSIFTRIFLQLCIGIDIEDEWFGIADELISFINNRVMALD